MYMSHSIHVLCTHPHPPPPTHTQVHVVLSEVNQEQEVESDDMKLDPPSDHEVEARVDYYIYEEDENLSDTDTEDEWDKPTKV